MKRKKPAKKTAPAAGHRVLIVDDHPVVRMGLTEALAREPGLSVCGAFGTAEEALSAVGKLKPDVVVADLNLPGKSGLELVKDLASMHPRLPVIVLSMHDEDIYAERCLRAGARGYVMKSEGPEKLATALRHVLGGGTHVSPNISARIIEGLAVRRDRPEHSLISRLTDREFEIFQWIGGGLATQEIARRMHISPKTVETHRMHIKTKLNLATAGELIAYAARWVAVLG